MRNTDGWLRTGDFCRLDSEGYLFLSGRKGDKIDRGARTSTLPRSSGYWRQHPGVREAAMIGAWDH